MTTPNASLGVWCYKCGLTKLAEKMYRVNARKLLPDGTRTGVCRACKSAYQNEYRKQRSQTDPAWREQYNAYCRQYKAKRWQALTPEGREAIRRQRREGYRRMKADPVRYARHLKRSRVAARRYWLREKSRRRHIKVSDPARYASRAAQEYQRRRRRRLARAMLRHA